MRVAKTLGVLLASAVMASASVSAAYAQAEGTGSSVYGAGSYGATWLRAGVPPRKAGTAEACPGVMWDIMRMPGSGGVVSLNGPVWNTDGTGMSTARGEERPDGTFSLNITTVDGKGPAGTVTGKRNRDGSAQVVMVGNGTCNNMTMRLAKGQTSMKH